LEQRYLTAPGMEFRHLDLYRLSETEARQLLVSTEDFEGIRCIEWANKVPEDAWHGPLIRIHLSEERDGRKASVTFEDMDLPTEDEIAQWREETLLPPHITSHCEMTAKACDQLSALLLQKGIAVRPKALRCAAQLHDLLRFLDFHGGGSRGEEYTPEQLIRWEEWRQRFPLRHEEAATAFLKDRGYDGIGEIIFTHGFLSTRPPKTTEQKLLYYADKRSMNDRLATIDERFHDFLVRYGDGTNPSPEFVQWKKETRAMEQLLFPEGEPRLI
jgi:hypothetical protein